VRVIKVLSMPILLLVILGAISSRGVPRRISQTDLLKQKLEELQLAPDQGSVDWYVRRAKSTGEKEAILPGLHSCGPEVPDLGAFLRESDVIVAESIGRYVHVNELGLQTWYKFRIVEDLSLDPGRECSTCGNPGGEQQEIPAQLLPLASDEFVLSYIGGQMNIDGVKVVQPQTRSVDFSTGLRLQRSMPANEIDPAPYKSVANRQTFLMFLSISPGSRLGRLRLGDAGVFSFDSGGELTSFGDDGSIKLHLAKNRIHSLSTLREYQQRLRDRL
jgi:hypothetical protein